MNKLLLATTVVLAIAFPEFGFTGNRERPEQNAKPSGPEFASITERQLMDDIKVLSSDEFEGRAPGTHGEELSIKYVADQFGKAGLEPGNTDGSYFQNVPLVGITASNDRDLIFKAAGSELRLKFSDDYVAWTERVRPEARIDSDLVFV